MTYKILKIIIIVIGVHFLTPISTYAQKTFLITAASSGLGEGISEVLAAKGYTLILAGHTPEKLFSLKENLEKKYKGRYDVLTFDYQNLGSIEKLGKSLNQPLDGLVLIPMRSVLPPKEIPSPEEWNRAFHDVFIVPLEIVRVLKPKLKQDSSLVVISGLTSVHFLPAYANTNVLRIMWTAEVKNLARQLSDQKVRVNAVSPGVILTKHHIAKIQERAKKEGLSYEDQLAKEAAETPLKRFGDPKDVGGVVEFLLSESSRHINGTNMVLDGGLSQAY